MNPEHQKQSHGIFGIHPWPLGIILGFLLVFAVNFYVIWISIRSPHQLVVENYYQQGILYEQELEKNRDSLELGWKVDLIPVSGKEETWIQIRALDASGKPLEGLNGTLNLYRPSNRLEDTKLRLSEKSPGFYEIRTPKLASGLWQFRLELEDGVQGVFQNHYRRHLP